MISRLKQKIALMVELLEPGDTNSHPTIVMSGAFSWIDFNANSLNGRMKQLRRCNHKFPNETQTAHVRSIAVIWSAMLNKEPKLENCPTTRKLLT